MRTRCLVLLSLAAMALSAWAQLPNPSARQENAAAAGEIGSLMPEFSLKDLRGRSVSSAGLRGRVVLIDFWATWCQPCKKEMPGYQKLLDKYGSRGFVVIGLKFDTMTETENPLTFARKIGVHYPLAVASDDLKQKFGGIEGLPTTLLYDRNGILRTKVEGFEYTDTFESAVKRLLNQ